MIIRPQLPDDYDAIRHIYTAAFGKPLEAGIFEELWAAGDVIPALSFTALDGEQPVGHVTASRATVGADEVVAVGPIGVLPDRQNAGIGSALMQALLAAADAAEVPLIVLLGSPQYYGRFGFTPAAELGVLPPEPQWGAAFQARPLRAHTPALAGPFKYAPAFP